MAAWHSGPSPATEKELGKAEPEGLVTRSSPRARAKQSALPFFRLAPLPREGWVRNPFASPEVRGAEGRGALLPILKELCLAWPVR